MVLGGSGGHEEQEEHEEQEKQEQEETACSRAGTAEHKVNCS